MKSWDIFECHEGMNVLQSTWSFECKSFPGGIIWKLKAIFCVRGNKHIKGVDDMFQYCVGNKVTERITNRLRSDT